MADPRILSRFTVVLWRPSSPGNVGAAARAMKNMGVADLRVAEPVSYEDPGFFRTESERMAWNAGDLLESRREYPSLEAAVSDAVLVAGTIAEPPDGHEILSPRELAARMIEKASGGPVAILFGPERTGLTREALARCQLLGSVPSSEAYNSLNLAQAVLLFLYEIRLAALEAEKASMPPRSGGSRGNAEGGEGEAPTQADLEGFYERLLSVLDAIGFFEGTARAHMVRELRRIFNRALLTRREVQILEGIVHRIRLDRSSR